jgi:hypothetical protein
MPYALAVLVAGSTLWLLYVWRAAKSIPQGASAGSPAAIAETLVWYDGDLSPNGRRVLWVEPATPMMLAAMADAKAATWLAKGCPLDAGSLPARLPDDHVKEKVAWALTPDEVARIREGFTPESGDDKWRIVTVPVERGERVYLMRSWTGALVYVLDLGEHGVRWVWRGARDPLGVELARAVVDGYLLGRTCVVPAPRELGEDKGQLLAWGVKIAGRRCKAVEPGAS